jgi:CBS domain-containing protein
MYAREVMSSPVITVGPDTPVQAAAALLASHGFTAAPVVDQDGHMLGIVTEADLMQGQIPPEGWPGHVRRTEPPETVAQAMTHTAYGMAPGSDLADVVSLMLDADIRSVPIVDDGALVGIISRRDVLRVVARGELTSQDV